MQKLLKKALRGCQVLNRSTSLRANGSILHTKNHKLAVRPYSTQKDYWDVFFGAQEAVKKAWDAAGVLPAFTLRRKSL